MTSLANIRDTLSSRETERDETAVEQYDRLVTDLADETPRDDHDEIESILSETGRTIDDVESDFAGLKQRRQWAKQLEPSEPAVDDDSTTLGKGLQSLKDERDELQAQIAAAKKRADAAQKVLHELRKSVHPQLVDLDAPLAQLNDISRKLSTANWEAAKRGLARVDIE